MKSGFLHVRSTPVPGKNYDGYANDEGCLLAELLCGNFVISSEFVVKNGRGGGKVEK